MKSRSVLAASLFTAAVATIALVLAGSLGDDALAAQRGRGRGGPPAPCGPAGDLPAELNQNVAPDSRCFELRMYTADPSRDGVGDFEGGINELHQRFREKEVELFVKSGAEVVAVWQDLGNSDTLIYMLAYRDRAHRDEVWAAFSADPEWNELRLKYNVPLSATTYMMSATDYSPLK